MNFLYTTSFLVGAFYWLFSAMVVSSSKNKILYNNLAPIQLTVLFVKLRCMHASYMIVFAYDNVTDVHAKECKKCYPGYCTC